MHRQTSCLNVLGILDISGCKSWCIGLENQGIFIGQPFSVRKLLQQMLSIKHWAWSYYGGPEGLVPITNIDVFNNTMPI